MDEVMRAMQGSPEKIQVDRFRSLPVRVGVAGTLKLLPGGTGQNNNRCKGNNRGKGN